MKGKCAIVTGSTKGIGLGIAEEFARMGANVVINGRDADECESVAAKIAKKYKVKAIGIVCDMGKPEQIGELVSKSVKKFGRLDIFVNNAGIYPNKMIEKIEEKDWDAVIDINLKGSFYSIKEASRVMKPGGKILMISSIASIIGFPGLAHYCASKGGVSAMVRAAALELAPRKINVNAIAPGAIATPGTGEAKDESSKRMAEAIPMKRWGTPEDIAHAAAYLCSDGADYVTGHVLVVDGGWTVQ